MFIASDLNAPRNRSPEENRSPWKNGEEEDGSVIPERLDVLEFGGEEALEIVLDDEDAEKIGVAAGAQNIPGKSGEAEGRDGGGMQDAEGVAPAPREERPGKNGAAGENEGGGAFCKDGQAEEETEENKGEPRCSREDWRVFAPSE